MSIIQEALKKAQRKNIAVEPLALKKEPVRQDPSDEIPSYIKRPPYKTKSRPAAKKSNPRIILYGTILLCVALILFIQYFPSRPAKNVNVKAASTAAIPRAAVRPVAVIQTPAVARFQNIEPVRETQQSIDQDSFKLSGIMDLEDGRRAIINDLMVAEGDSVGTAEVTAITTDSVTLKKGEASLTLRLK